MVSITGVGNLITTGTKESEKIKIYNKFKKESVKRSDNLEKVITSCLETNTDGKINEDHPYFDKKIIKMIGDSTLKMTFILKQFYIMDMSVYSELLLSELGKIQEHRQKFSVQIKSMASSNTPNKTVEEKIHFCSNDSLSIDHDKEKELESNELLWKYGDHIQMIYEILFMCEAYLVHADQDQVDKNKLTNKELRQSYFESKNNVDEMNNTADANINQKSYPRNPQNESTISTLDVEFKVKSNTDPCQTDIDNATNARDRINSNKNSAKRVSNKSLKRSNSLQESHSKITSNLSQLDKIYNIEEHSDSNIIRKLLNESTNLIINIRSSIDKYIEGEKKLQNLIEQFNPNPYISKFSNMEFNQVNMSSQSTSETSDSFDDENYRHLTSFVKNIDTYIETFEQKYKNIISIRIPTFKIVNKGTKPFCQFIIRIFVANEVFDVYRRYNSFLKLYTDLCLLYPKLRDFCFPKKKTYGNLDSSFLKYRKSRLEEFLTHLVDLIKQKYIILPIYNENESNSDISKKSFKEFHRFFDEDYCD